jgi:hypothetical protein
MKTNRFKSFVARAGAMALAALLSLQIAGPAAAQPYRFMSCDELWYERNAIYAEKGYCFETRRARRVFGDACFPPFGRLTQWEQHRVDEILRWERRKGC